MFEKWVHLDLKGGIMKADALIKLFPFFKRFGATGLLIEYEDAFPFRDELKLLRNANAYDDCELKSILEAAKASQLACVPLLQTFGHLEFVLKHDQFRALRESDANPGSICPSCPESMQLIKAMMQQVFQFYRDCGMPLRFVHIGCDEVYSIKECTACLKSAASKHDMFLAHVIRVVNAAKLTQNEVLQGKKPDDAGDLCILFWDDMLRTIPEQVLQASQIRSCAIPMIWHYLPQFHLEPTYFDMLARLFSTLWAASAFKGANGPERQLVETQLYVENNVAWLDAMERVNHTASSSPSCSPAQPQPKFQGIALTGWSRFDHLMVLCEVLPAALPCLALCLTILREGRFTQQLHHSVSRELHFPELIPWQPSLQTVDPSVRLEFCGFEVFQSVSGWHLLCGEFDSCTSEAFFSRHHFSRYNRTHRWGNAFAAQQLADKLADIRDRFSAWKRVFTPFWRQQFIEDCITEWMQQNVEWRLKKLDKYIDQARQISLVGDSAASNAAAAASDMEVRHHGGGQKMDEEQ